MKHFAALGVVASLAFVSVSAQEIVFHPVQFAVDLGGVGFRVPIEAKIVKGAPYSADVVTESIQTLADGNRIVQRSGARVYRDSEGRTRREENRASGGQTISVTDPVAGLSFSLDPENHIAFQTRAATKVSEALQKVRELAPGVAERVEKMKVQHAEELKQNLKGVAARLAEARRLREQVVIDKLPARDIEGVRAEGVRRTTTIQAGAIGNDWPIEIVSEEWFSPALKMLVLTERRDPRVGTSTYRVTNIIRAEPDRYLFEVPSDYTVQQTSVFRKPLPARVQK